MVLLDDYQQDSQYAAWEKLTGIIDPGGLNQVQKDYQDKNGKQKYHEISSVKAK